MAMGIGEKKERENRRAGGRRVATVRPARPSVVLDFLCSTALLFYCSIALFFLARRGKMEPRGIEPRFAECDSAVIPLDHGPGQRRAFYGPARERQDVGEKRVGPRQALWHPKFRE